MHSTAIQQDLPAILDSLTVGVIRVDLTWRIVYVNAYSHRLFDDKPDPLMGRDFWSLLDTGTDGFKAALQASPGSVDSGEFKHRDRHLRIEVAGVDQGGRIIQIFEVSPNGTAELDREITKRKEAEKALDAQQQFLQAVLDDSEAGIVACDENGTLKLFNNAARAFHGLVEAPLPPEEWSSQYDLYYPDGTTLLRKDDVPLYRAFSGEIVRHAELVIAPAHGKRRTLLASGRPLVGRDGRSLGAVVAMHDITHRKISGARLRLALRQFRALFNDAPIAYHEIDREGIIRRVNRTECRLLERTREELVGRHVWDLVVAQERHRNRSAVLDTVWGLRAPTSRELKYITASGRHVVVQTFENLIYGKAGEITGLRTAILDITDRKERDQQAQALVVEKYGREQAEAAVAQISSILERIGDAYIAFDTEWRYTYVNQKAAELALRSASELIGKSVWEEFPEAVHTSFYSELQRAMREQAPIEFDNYFAPLGKWFENSVYPSPSGVGVFYRDITERVRIRRALEKSAEELARKNAELETFAYVASHDLQEPLRMIGGYAELLARKYTGKLDADADEFISFITEGVNRMQRFIRDLLALSRLTDAAAAPMVDVSLEQIMEIVCGDQELLIEDVGGAILWKDLPVLKHNETQLFQVMQNLVGNALKYRRTEPPRIEVHAQRQETAWQISVRDNGAGFEMSRAADVFKPFNRLQMRDDRGTGIGLAICKKIVESRGGHIWVHSTPGVGSEFSFTVPDALPAAD